MLILLCRAILTRLRLRCVLLPLLLLNLMVERRRFRCHTHSPYLIRIYALKKKKKKKNRITLRHVFYSVPPRVWNHVASERASDFTARTVIFQFVWDLRLPFTIHTRRTHAFCTRQFVQYTAAVPSPDFSLPLCLPRSLRPFVGAVCLPRIGFFVLFAARAVRISYVLRIMPRLRTDGPSAPATSPFGRCAERAHLRFHCVAWYRSFRCRLSCLNLSRFSLTSIPRCRSTASAFACILRCRCYTHHCSLNAHALRAIPSEQTILARSLYLCC